MKKKIPLEELQPKTVSTSSTGGSAAWGNIAGVNGGNISSQADLWDMVQPGSNEIVVERNANTGKVFVNYNSGRGLIHLEKSTIVTNSTYTVTTVTVGTVTYYKVNFPSFVSVSAIEDVFFKKLAPSDETPAYVYFPMAPYSAEGENAIFFSSSSVALYDVILINVPNGVMTTSDRDIVHNSSLVGKGTNGVPLGVNDMIYKYGENDAVSLIGETFNSATNLFDGDLVSLFINEDSFKTLCQSLITKYGTSKKEVIRLFNSGTFNDGDDQSVILEYDPTTAVRTFNCTLSLISDANVRRDLLVYNFITNTAYVPVSETFEQGATFTDKPGIYVKSSFKNIVIAGFQNIVLQFKGALTAGPMTLRTDFVEDVAPSYWCIFRDKASTSMPLADITSFTTTYLGENFTRHDINELELRVRELEKEVAGDDSGSLSYSDVGFYEGETYTQYLRFSYDGDLPSDHAPTDYGNTEALIVNGKKSAIIAFCDVLIAGYTSQGTYQLVGVGIAGESAPASMCKFFLKYEIITTVEYTTYKCTWCVGATFDSAETNVCPIFIYEYFLHNATQTVTTKLTNCPNFTFSKSTINISVQCTWPAGIKPEDDAIVLTVYGTGSHATVWRTFLLAGLFLQNVGTEVARSDIFAITRSYKTKDDLPLIRHNMQHLYDIGTTVGNTVTIAGDTSLSDVYAFQGKKNPLYLRGSGQMYSPLQPIMKDDKGFGLLFPMDISQWTTMTATKEPSSQKTCIWDWTIRLINTSTTSTPNGPLPYPKTAGVPWFGYIIVDLYAWGMFYSAGSAERLLHARACVHYRYKSGASTSAKWTKPIFILSKSIGNVSEGSSGFDGGDFDWNTNSDVEPSTTYGADSITAKFLGREYNLDDSSHSNKNPDYNATPFWATTIIEARFYNTDNPTIQ